MKYLLTAYRANIREFIMKCIVLEGDVQSELSRTASDAVCQRQDRALFMRREKERDSGLHAHGNCVHSNCY